MVQEYLAGAPTSVRPGFPSFADFMQWREEVGRPEATWEEYIAANTSTPTTLHYLTVSISPSGGGYVTTEPAGELTRPPQELSFPADSYVTLTAAAWAGYKFDRWSGDFESTTNPIRVRMIRDRRVVANFIATVEPKPREGWQAAEVVTGLAVSQMIAKDMWVAKAVIQDLIVDTAALWQAKEAISLGVEAALLWMPQEVLQEGLAVSGAGAEEIWVSCEVLQSGLAIDVAVGELPPEEPEKGIVWWPWVLGGVALAVLIGFLARRR